MFGITLDLTCRWHVCNDYRLGCQIFWYYWIHVKFQSVHEAEELRPGTSLDHVKSHIPYAHSVWRDNKLASFPMACRWSTKRPELAFNWHLYSRGNAWNHEDRPRRPRTTVSYFHSLCSWLIPLKSWVPPLQHITGLWVTKLYTSFKKSWQISVPLSGYPRF